MQCENIRCPHYRKPTKRDAAEILIGTTRKQGGCVYPWCKIKYTNKGVVK